MSKIKKKFDTREEINQNLRDRIGAAESLKKLEKEDIDDIIQILFHHAFDDHQKPIQKKLVKVIDEISARIVQGR